MKKVVLVPILILSLFSSYSQNKANNKLEYGFSIGVNYSNLFKESNLPPQLDISNGLGFTLGVLVDYKILDFLSVSPKANLTFNGGSLSQQLLTNIEKVYEIMPVCLDFKLDFVLKKTKGKINPYFLVGPNFRLAIFEDITDPTVFPTGNDLAIDFGIGLDKTFSKFKLAPELRYSFGLLNVVRNPIIQGINLHTISLVFNFKD